MPYSEISQGLRNVNKIDAHACRSKMKYWTKEKRNLAREQI